MKKEDGRGGVRLLVVEELPSFAQPLSPVVARHPAAVRELEAWLANTSRRRGALYGAARAAEMAGNSTKAAEFRKQLLALSSATAN